MATHININEFKTEPWFNVIRSNITDCINDLKNKNVNPFNPKLQLLPYDYCINGSDTVFMYKTNLDYDLTEGDIPLAWCNIEVHLKRNKLNDIFIVA